MSTKQSFYEDDVKQLVLNNKRLFLPFKDMKSVVLSEKGIDINSVIADLLIFRSDGILIGVEVKTARDSTTRLNKQLRAYSKICDLVYVVCEDKHVEKVDAIIREYKHQGVGIIAYTEFRGEGILGMYSEAYPSPRHDVKAAFNSLFWKEELLNIAGSFKRQVSTLSGDGAKVGSADSRGAIGMNGLLVQSGVSSRMKKSQIASHIVERLGPDRAKHLLCNMYINGKMHPEKTLNKYYFQ
ncbi:sce7726 family protein [Bacillus phage NotTheCreek]|uniref:sce7726 family protein n=1 Tax=Bacillus phage NotTheCreek TaxID=1805952 RepID=UPI0007A7736E|nr:sce7726 family protein [Bacillus phage NotTheCreek]AMW63421.1 hypothetical protein NOTTHECREEK_202 [Bacillus phage NotTheCreek]